MSKGCDFEQCKITTFSDLGGSSVQPCSTRIVTLSVGGTQRIVLPFNLMLWPVKFNWIVLTFDKQSRPNTVFISIGIENLEFLSQAKTTKLIQLCPYFVLKH